MKSSYAIFSGFVAIFMRILVLALLTLVCFRFDAVDWSRAKEGVMSGELHSIPKGCDFSAVENNSVNEYPCSPRLHDNYFDPFLGLLINGPEITTWPSDLSPNDLSVGPFGQTVGPFRLMFSGVVKLPYGTMGLNGEFSDQVTIVAVDQNNGQTYTGRIWFPESLQEPESDYVDDLFPDAVENSEDDLKKPVLNYFNIDLVNNLGVPVRDATYTVYATLGDYTSNVLTVETRIE
ncbi:hypothetical protein ACXYTJ_00385 [Gilvimarinus sp. F26214L]|uniref:hypothetical protein n=1 Tax=Gilvimarinus sp. DZF01 TaxID=3461371 RepID=UPI004045A440